MPQLNLPEWASVNPEATPMPRQRFDVNADMFGANVGREIKGLGQTISASGDSFAKEALDNQALVNEDASNKATTDYITQAAPEIAKLRSMNPADAAAYTPTFMQNITAIQSKVRDGLGNPMAKRMFDRGTSRMAALEIQNGAIFGAQQSKIAMRQNADAVGTLKANAASALQDGDQFDSQWAARAKEIDESTQWGSQEEKDVQKAKEKDLWITNKVNSLAQGADADPDRAKAFLDRQMKKPDADLSKLNVLQERLKPILASQTVNDAVKGAFVTGPKTSDPAVAAAISKAAAKNGVPENVLNKFAEIESSFDPNANRNNTRDAKGLFQFVSTTGKQYGLTGDKVYDAEANADAAARLYNDNKAALQKQLGREPTPGEVYLAHQQGAAGAAGLLKYPNASAASVVGEPAVTGNGGTAGMSAGDFAKKWTSKFDNLGNGDPSGTLGSTQEQAARTAAAAGTARGFNPVEIEKLQDQARQGVAAKFNQQQTAIADVKHANINTLGEAIIGDGSTDGGISDMEQITGNDAKPELKTAYYALDQQTQGKIRQAVAQHGLGKDTPPTLEAQLQMDSYRGQYVNNPRQFMAETENYLLEDMPKAQKKEIGAMRMQVQKQDKSAMNATLNVNNAMSVLQRDGTLKQIGIDARNRDNVTKEYTQKYDQFTGALSRELSAWTSDPANKGKRISTEEIQAIGKRLIEEKIIDGTGWGGSDWFREKKRQYELTNPTGAPVQTTGAPTAAPTPKISDSTPMIEYEGKKYPYYIKPTDPELLSHPPGTPFLYRDPKNAGKLTLGKRAAL